MSKNDSQPNLWQRINVGVAAGIVAILALTATVIGIELYGLKGLTGRMVIQPSENWSVDGPNVSFGAVTLYRTNKLRQIAELEAAKGSDPQNRAQAQQIITDTNALDKEILTALKNHGISRSSLKIPMPNLYADYGVLLKSMQGATAEQVELKFRSRLHVVELKMRRQVQVDAMQVAAKELAKAASLAAALSSTILH